MGVFIGFLLRCPRGVRAGQQLATWAKLSDKDIELCPTTTHQRRAQLGEPWQPWRWVCDVDACSNTKKTASRAA